MPVHYKSHHMEKTEAAHKGLCIQEITRKHRQSYRHADPRRHEQHTAVAARVTSNRTTVTVFVTV